MSTVIINVKTSHLLSDFVNKDGYLVCNISEATRHAFWEQGKFTVFIKSTFYVTGAAD